MAIQGDPTLRFTDRVANYVRYRPGYPPEIVTTLAAECGLTPASAIADIGCGPGNLARIFLDNGNTVIGVEPNTGMREAGIRELADFGQQFRPTGTRAEATELATGSIDFVTAGQAFHWFDPEHTRAEFARILRPGGWCALIWNEHDRNSPFLEEYDELLVRYGRDYAAVRKKRNSALDVEQFFAPQPVNRREFAYVQHLDFEGLAGRLVSSSYSPQPPDPAFEPMIGELRNIHDRHSENGRIAFRYETFLHYGRLSRA